MNYLIVAVGGMFGALSRYFLFVLLAEKSMLFPWATFIVNMTGCFAMGFVTETCGLKASLPPEIKILLTTGFLGAFTTFSTFSLDIVNLLNKGAVLTVVIYAAMSVLLGILGVYAGSYLSRFLLV